jgi:hypothetical protein
MRLAQAMVAIVIRELRVGQVSRSELIGRGIY